MIRFMERRDEMKFSRRMLVVITLVGLPIGLHEAWHLAGGLVILMAMQIGILAVVAVTLVRAVRRESAQGEIK